MQCNVFAIYIFFIIRERTKLNFNVCVFVVCLFALEFMVMCRKCVPGSAKRIMSRKRNEERRNG